MLGELLALAACVGAVFIGYVMVAMAVGPDDEVGG